jgi:hypothetical protein
MLVLAGSLPLVQLPARANVYVTNLRLNGAVSNALVAAGSPLSVSYILNEAASLGIKLSIVSGTNTLRTVSLGPGTSGTMKGTNTLVWDGLDDHGAALPQGAYTVSLTAASSGYTNWTMISPDGTNNLVFDAYGIAVNRNPASPYYGRVYVANALGSPAPASDEDRAGILKRNADGTPADEGGFSTGGYPWPEFDYGAWKIEISDDDYVYVSDRSSGGLVLRWEATISTNSQTAVLRPDNLSPSGLLTGMAVVGGGANAQLLMADSNLQTNRGILSWSLSPSGVCASNDLGTTLVAVGGDLALNVAPLDVAADPEGNLYTCQSIPTGSDLSARLLRFPSPVAIGSIPVTNADWAVGSGDPTYVGASGVALDPSGQFLAAAFAGNTNPRTNGCTRIFSATNGALVADLDLGIALGGEVIHTDTDCAWDAVGNVYLIDNYIAKWRVFSPPGTNQATTVAPARLVVGPAEPQITSLQFSNNQVVLTFLGGAEDAPDSFFVTAASAVEGPYTNVAAIFSALPSPNTFRAIVLQPSPAMKFFRVVRQAPPPAPQILSIGVAGGVVTMNFLGQTNDATTAYTLLSASVVSGTYSTVAEATFTATSPGVYRCTVATNGPVRFYRIQR